MNRQMGMALALLSFFLMGATEGRLRPQYHKVSYSPHSFISEGVFIGGEALEPASLLKVKLLKSKSGSSKERIYFQMGDAEGGVRSRLTYFHVAVESKPSRIVLDFSNLQKTAIGPEEIRSALKGSKLIRTSSITMDPIDRSTNVTIDLVSPRRVSAFLAQNRPGRVYLEIRGGATEPAP